MRILNFATVTVDTTAGGTLLVSNDQMRQVSGAMAVVVNPSADIYLVTNMPSGTAAGDVAGTAANSPFYCPAGVPTVISHTRGDLRAITASGSSTVRVGIGCAP